MSISIGIDPLGFIGDIFSNSANARAQKSANATNIALADAANRTNIDIANTDRLFQAQVLERNEAFQREGALRNEAFQRETGQNAIQWRVADATAAGIHPLYAMGNPGISATPSSYAGSSVSPSGIGVNAPQVMPHIRQMGQNLSRAEISVMSKEERARRAMEMAGATLDLENKKLHNDLLASQIARESAVHIGPSQPIASTGPLPASSLRPSLGGRVQPQPSRPVVSSPYNPAREPGAIADYGFSRSSSGGLTVVQGKDIKERTEDSPQELMWMMRNQIIPAIKGLPAPSAREFPLPKGATHWRWSALRQEFLPARPHGKGYQWYADGKWGYELR